MSKKSALANIMFSRLKFVTLPIFSAIRPNFFYVLAYHRVFQLPGPDYPFQEGTISAAPEEFEKQIRFIKKRFNVINFSVLSNILSSGETLPDNPIVITFDDGYADNYDPAFNILMKHGLTATVFLVTSCMDSANVFWFDKLAYIIKKIPRGPISLDSGKYIFDVTDINRKETIKSIVGIFRSVSDKDRLRLLEELEHESKIQIEPDHLKLIKPLNWTQIKEMSDNGIEIGSHTVNHPFLANLTGEEMIYELAESKRVIEEKTGKQVKSVAYPAGSYDQRVIRCARDCGYEFGISYKHGVKRYNKDEMFTIPRIYVETDVDFPLFQANLLFPQLFVRYGG